jgi:phage-related protein
LAFYCSASGAEPVRDWLMTLPAVERRVIGLDLMRVQWRWPVGMPLCRPMGQGLWEVRCDLPGNRSARVFFCVHCETLVAVHGMLKKSSRTPAGDLELARKRVREIKQ